MYKIYKIRMSGWGFKGKTMERGGGPKRSYAGGKIRETKGELYYTKLNATITVCETKGVQKPQNKVAKKAARQSNNKRKQRDKVQIKNQSSTQTWKTQN